MHMAVERRSMLTVYAVRPNPEGRCSNDDPCPLIRRMVRPERFELPTFWFVARRSIQLS
jgi:hypothetical protein